jgi:hypothetical protein
LDLGIATLHVLCQTVSLGFQLAALVLQRLELTPEIANALLRTGEGIGDFLLAGDGGLAALQSAVPLDPTALQLALIGFEFLTVLLQIALGALQVGLAAGKRLTTISQTLLKLVELKQTHPQALTHQKHQAQGDGTDQAACEGRDHHRCLPWPQVEQTEAGFADFAAEPISKSGENPSQHEQGED